jgi:hypothetical protein
MEWQQDSENGLTGAAFELDQPFVTTDEILRNGKAETGAIGASGDQGVEQCIAQLFGHSRAVVLELHTGDQSMAARADVDVR